MHIHCLAIISIPLHTSDGVLITANQSTLVDGEFSLIPMQNKEGINQECFVNCFNLKIHSSLQVEVPDYMMNLHFPTLQAEPPELKRKMNGTLCGWGHTTADSFNASLGTAGSSNNLRCMVLKILSADLCKISFSQQLVLNFRIKHMCGAAINPRHKITLVIIEKICLLE